MNTHFVRRTLTALVATFAAGSAIAAADPVLVLESRVDLASTYAFAIESRSLCVRFGVVVTDDTVEVGPTSRCPACRTKDLA